MASNDWNHVKSKTTIANVIHEVEKQPFILYHVYEDDSIEKTLKVMTEKNITGVPVASRKTNEIIGAIDTLDVVAFASARLGVLGMTIAQGQKEAEKFKQPVKNILNLADKEKWRVASANTNLAEAISLLSSQFHRISIRDDHKPFKTAGTLTQSALLRYLLKHQDKLPQQIIHKKIKEAFVFDGKVETVSLRSFVIDALMKISELKVSGVAIVDENGVLVGNISANDIKRMDLTPEQLVLDVNEQLRDFLNIYSAERALSNDIPRIVPVYIDSEADVLHLMQTFVEKKVHRIFVVDEKKHPLKAISLGDTISLFK